MPSTAPSHHIHSKLNPSIPGYPLIGMALHVGAVQIPDTLLWTRSRQQSQALSHLLDSPVGEEEVNIPCIDSSPEVAVMPLHAADIASCHGHQAAA